MKAATFRPALSVLALLLTTASGVLGQQAQPNPAEARMRDALKKLTQRIAEADAATATAQAAQIAAEAKLKESEGTVAELTRKLKEQNTQATADKEAGRKVVETLESKLSVKEKEAAALTTSLTNWKAGFEKARDVATIKEGERATAAGRIIELDRQVAAHQRKNREMYKLGNEILDRYKSFGLGTALLSREPFVGSMRVKFQNYVQDYGDKLDAQQIKPGDGKVAGAAPSATSGEASKP